jgi:predicted GNAT family N-acyltransferase
MAVDESHQRQGVGSMLLGYAENFCVLNDYFHIELHARKVVQDFYSMADYQIEGEEFLEVGIPHIRMVKQLPISR